MLQRTLFTLWVACAVACSGDSKAAAHPPKKLPQITESKTMSDYKKPSAEQIKANLTPEQYRVTQQCGTEPPFRNAFWDNHAAGIYVDVVSGEPLFSSLDKYDSGTGWPSFSKPLDPANVVEREDKEHGMTRTEVRSKHADSHLGHVFNDGPSPSGERYCMNSSSLRFIPAEKLVEAGYGQYAKLFPSVKQSAAAKTRETAILAGGCFWGMEEILRKIPGVHETEVGYTGGKLARPSYQDVTTGSTGHAEAVRIVFDPNVLSYEALLGYFFRMHEPTTLNRQHGDVGTQYRSAIFYTSPEQQKVAEAVKDKTNRSGKFKDPIVTQVVSAGEFYKAEDYHQDYLIKNPGGYTCHVLRD